MKAAVCTGVGEIEIRDVPKPEPGPGEVLVRVKSAGVCGSDVDGYRGKHPMIGFPVILGHECSGEIAETGEGVDPGRVGEAVTVEPFFTCGECAFCEQGTYNFCSNLKIIGHQVDGAFAEYVLIPSKFAHFKPENVSFDEAAILEPCSGSLHAVRRCNIQSGDFVTVIGCGTMGSFTVQHCRNLGAEVLVIEPAAFKRELARELGAAHVLGAADGEKAAYVAEKTGGKMSDVVIEAVGEPETLFETVGLVKNGGVIMLIGWTGRDSDAFDLTNTTFKELTVLGTLGFCRDFPVSMQLLSQGKIDIERIISHRFGLEEVKEAIELLERGDDNVLKAVVNV
ncbi:MAG: alcohol dehydrogenase catalytic domain-containing protein [Kiritimatiellia bacterium]